ncbi:MULTISPECIES: peptide chain release factor 1 [Dictyoglomus]|jgi:peptide chain release factor 1|uniref:Peptide chain release factor 1 n=1 Tax=Dictyoglomus turgidum (strain DSM 6724 / Z-1310) TaxID=515635 RepID=RF1_DICTD|nr:MULTISPECIES: peptide chain release factor 1 [Dictyoglomus]B8E003.1 RecName: Full=Peptide chain release factor 1; Short=RF-1 [Dictyoglomus turgidum DSM 6724]ACK42086.1 peptide chain release factor 1 [Dictyoglomus turgidum DSM 6724]HBU32317.1 peptide chain release factor 1 [Dictyoglomus sp.]
MLQKLVIDKLEEIEKRFEEIEGLLAKEDVISDFNKYQSLLKERAKIEEIVDKFREYKRLLKEKEDLEEMVKEEQDEDLRSLAETELEDIQEKLEKVEFELKALLLPKDPNDEKNIIMEIRAGTGGEEAALFAADLFRMYLGYAQKKGWKVEIVSSNPTGLGGFKEIIFIVEGKGAYSRLKFESGVHRVQRVPITESSGRIHTSTATVAVLPEMEEIEVEIDPKDLRIETFRSGGAGGQHVNKTESGVRITHIPSGIVVQCQDERSQHQNREKAMKVLRARLYEYYQREKENEIASQRRQQVGTGERSEKIRTYNFPQRRVTDHRINYSSFQLEEVLSGELDEFIDRLILAEKEEQIKKLFEEVGATS